MEVVAEAWMLLVGILLAHIFFSNLLESAYEGDKITLGTFPEIALKSKYLS